MKITNNEAISAHNFLANLKLSGFDKDIRVAIFKNVGELAIAVKAVQDKTEASKKELFKGLEKDGQQVGALREEFHKEETTKERRENIVKEILAYEAYIEAEKELNEVVMQFGKDELELSLVTIDFDKFIDGLINSDIEFTALQLQVMAFMFNKIG